MIAFAAAAPIDAQPVIPDNGPPISAKVDEMINAWMQNRHIPGLALAVIREGKIIKLQSYGQANIETGTPVTEESVFMTASLSKQFIATAVLLLQQEGRLSLDDRAAKYIDSLPVSWNEITIAQLLSHTSGIIRDPSDYHPYTDQPVMEVIRSMYDVPLRTKTGEQWLYSNVGYYILAELITRVSGKPWDSFITERIFTPAGMKNTRTTSVKDIVAHRAAGYHYTTGGILNAENWIAVRPSGAFLSTIRDLAVWDIFLDKSNLLNEQSRRLLWTPTVLNSQKPVLYGLGWYVESFLGRARVHHDGQYPGFRADYERFSDDRLSVIILANLDNGGLESLALQTAALYEPNLVPPPFGVTVSAPGQAVDKGVVVPIEISVTDKGKAAPGTVMEMEIWDESGKPVNKQNRQNENFAPAETKTFNFSWTPVQPGVYTVNIGVYGPRWTPSYSWNVKLATITVR